MVEPGGVLDLRGGAGGARGSCRRGEEAAEEGAEDREEEVGAALEALAVGRAG